MLDELRDNIESVLKARCPRLAVHAHIDGRVALGEALWREAATLGWLRIGVCEDRGGLGLGAPGLAALHGALGGWFAPGCFVATLSALQWLHGVDWPEGTDVLEAIAAGERRVAIPADLSAPALTESGGRATGTITMLGDATSELYLLPLAGDDWGLFETQPAIRAEALEMWDRTRGICAIACMQAAPLARWSVGAQEGAGRLLGHVSLAIASDSLGGVRAITAQTIDYLNTRIQFDRPVGSFQALKHRIADLAAGTVTQEHLIEQAIAGQGIWTEMAKASASDWYVHAAGDCVQLHGGVGHTWEYDVHIAVKRAHLNQALGLPNATIRERAAAALEAAARAGTSLLEIAA